MGSDLVQFLSMQFFLVRVVILRKPSMKKQVQMFHRWDIQLHEGITSGSVGGYMRHMEHSRVYSRDSHTKT